MEILSNISVVIPAYNEGTKIQEVLNSLKNKYDYNLVVIDDGSSDDTYEKYIKVSPYTLKHIINRGAGAATETGIKFALNYLKSDYIILLDADGQNHENELEPLIQKIKTENLDIILGSRFMNGYNNQVPFKKHILHLFGRIYTFLLSNIWLTDNHNGFRIMNKKAASLMKFTFSRFEFSSEMQDIVSVNKLKFKEVQINVSYTEYSKQKGQKISNSIRIIFNFLWKKINDCYI